MLLHKNLSAWYNRLQARGREKRGYIEDVYLGELTDDDLRDSNAEWTSVPCKELDWVAQTANDRSAEMAGTGTRDQLAKSHRNFAPPPSSPSGHTNRYGYMRTLFAANVHLDRLGVISDALLGQRTWEDLEVDFEVYKIFSKDDGDPNGDKIKAMID
ncbi:hypothetical protein LTR56_018443 [Elasticomyces elasticus]|nr:hypothetical protein LTR22_026542 [Elasticomyces elasticus]KAK3628722.1 hypothetical protein LTR56_018443 [Elasticomyces elasticus]KAK4908387.1 hypothetical protein LTR49_022700 [Elasticomyces elasticus]KAK5751715.1 hypothetical protein LTS12_018190 [Elasticomyces elasticus]